MSAYKNEDLFKALSELEIFDQDLLKLTFNESQEQGILLGDMLLSKDLITDDNLGKIIADLLGLSFIDLSSISIPKDVLQLVPESVASEHGIVAYKKDNENLYIATNNPTKKKVFEFLSKKVDLPLKIAYTSSRCINSTLSLYKQSITKAFDDIISENVKEAKGKISVDPPIVKIVDTIINYAYQSNASDVHIEPLKEKTLIRFRIDGIMQDIIKLPKDLNNQIVTRLKVMASLRTDEHQQTQDGKISFKTDSTYGAGSDLDIRISIAPITRGESVVMRLLSEKSRQFSLTDLGLVGDDLEKVVEAYKKPHGMILSTGPTGSGKSTTLYSILKLINKREINIMTIEDPVEYQIENINQIQVNSKTDLTFAKGLRSIVRQDPDVILVGEIRDSETADIAVNSAMTGHLVLSTLHTNDAVTTFPRLIDMGVEPYLIASTVNVVLAQRLVRKICSKCRVSRELPYGKLNKQIQNHLEKNKKFMCYFGKGCPVCRNTGYSGRVGIFEVLVMTDELNESIIQKKSADDLKKIALKQGMRTMLQDGILKVKQGVTTLDELMRVTMD